MAETTGTEVDVVVVGAGFAGLYLLHELRRLGFSTRLFESADDVGGTWYWNRYPGARCDIPTTDYTYSWDPELEEQWTWSEKYATQPEIFRYAQFVADKHRLRPLITFGARVAHASWDDTSRRWTVEVEQRSGREVVRCRHYVMATGCLSVPKTPDIAGAERFGGSVYVTGRWPHHDVDFTGQRVAVIGTGSSGIQSIPLIARQAAQLTVFQRTPNFSVPAHNGPVDRERSAVIAADRAAYRHAARYSRGGIPGTPTDVSALTASDEVRRQRFEDAWAKGELFAILGVFNDTAFNRDANEVVAEMIREKIRTIVRDPATAEALSPRDHPFGTKRPCLDTGYFATFNEPHVRLVDLRTTPIVTITESGVDLPGESLEFDSIVYATGFDAMTGAIVSVDITGRDGVRLRDKWTGGPTTYLGLTTTGFPNLFLVTGPGSPSVLSNMMVSIEQHVDWIVDCASHMRANDLDTIEPTATAEAGWVQHVNDCADITLYPTANSWYIGANVPGKPRVFLPYLGGVDGYRLACEEVVANDYLGFRFEGAAGVRCRDGVVRRLQPDVKAVLDMLGQLDLPALESMSPEAARQFAIASSAARPPGPAVGNIVDGSLPADDGTPLSFRLYRPSTPGPHPVVVWFHGGGWVIGNQVSDEPICRDLCDRTGAAVISVDYRHAPEHRFPTAALDAAAAVRWVVATAASFGGDPARIAVAGWSAGANLAAVTCQMLRGAVRLAGQVLLTPVTDGSRRHPSFHDNAEGYLLTAALMDWFWEHYATPEQRRDPLASPLLQADLTGLPPALVVTCEFDPLRDEGDAYARALADAGVPVEHVEARGHIHSSITMVDVVLSGARHRQQMADGLRRMLSIGG